LTGVCLDCHPPPAAAPPRTLDARRESAQRSPRGAESCSSRRHLARGSERRTRALLDPSCQVGPPLLRHPHLRSETQAPCASRSTSGSTGGSAGGRSLRATALCRIQTARMGGPGTPHSRGIDDVGSADGLSLAQHPCSWPSEPRAPRMAASARGGCPARPSPLSPAPVALTPLAAWLAVGQGHGQRGWPAPPALAGLTAPSPVGTADGPAASNRGGQQVGAPSALRMATPPRERLQPGPASHRQRGWH